MFNLGQAACPTVHSNAPLTFKRSCLIVYCVVLSVTGAVVRVCTIDITGTGFYQLAKQFLTASHRPTIVKTPVARMLLPAADFMDQTIEKHRRKANSTIIPTLPDALLSCHLFHLYTATNFTKTFPKITIPPQSLHREVGLQCKRQDSSLKMAKIAVFVTIPFNSQTGVVISHVQLFNKLLAKKKRKSLIGHKLNVPICTDCTYSHEYKYGHP